MSTGNANDTQDPNTQPSANNMPDIPTLDDIALNAFNPIKDEDPLPPQQTPDVNLGNDSQPPQPSGIENPPTDPFIADPSNLPTPNDPVKELENLQSDIDNAEHEGDPSPEGLTNFKRLKTRYKNQIDKFKQQHLDTVNQNVELQRQLDNASKYKDTAEKYAEISPRLEQLEQENLALKQENQSLSVFRKKYDLENDPQINKAFIDPMNQIRTKALDIIENSGKDKGFWKDLLSSDSEFSLIQSIENSGITGLNAQYLKNYVDQYSHLKGEYDKVSSPEYIDATIQTALGKSIQVSDEKAGEIFNAQKTAFSEHISELKKDEINKEHNFLVHDKIVEKAEKTFGQLKQVLGPQYQNDQVLSVMAQSAILTAVYPYTNKMLRHALTVNKQLATELANVNAAPEVTQTREIPSPKHTNGEITVNSIKEEASKSLDDITMGVFTELNG